MVEIRPGSSKGWFIALEGPRIIATFSGPAAEKDSAMFAGIKNHAAAVIDSLDNAVVADKVLKALETGHPLGHAIRRIADEPGAIG